MNLFSLSAQQKYFQQHVAYDIKVALDDRKNYLRGTISIVYTNNSPDTLPFIWMHLWPNAYSDRSTDLSKQLMQNGRKQLYFSKESEQGFIDSLNFVSDGKRLVFNSKGTSSEMEKLELNTPLLPGSFIEITTPFRVKIPSGKFSRMGYVGQSFQISQWYPKPAVYDRDGWQQMPYLDQGEFYSEFGSYKVAITLPENYVVAATGKLQENSEKEWLMNKVKATGEITKFDSSLAFPASASNFKTITYFQDSIHDFAWFADKRFHVLKKDFRLEEGGNTIEAWSFFTNAEAALWKNSIDYIESGIKFYSENVGAYPYSHYTAVDGTISAGGGMEYPMITVIGKSGDAFTLEDVIVHELGHSWFYGILGSNERENGWMDEGINSYFEMEFVNQKYSETNADGKNDMGSGYSFGSFTGTSKLTMKDGFRLAYKFSSFDNSDQPVKTPSRDFTYLNYGAVMYNKTALAFDFLNDYLGDAVFDKAMKTYFAGWKFKHPDPKDLQIIFEEVTGKNLNWFFGGLLGSNSPVHYSICSSSAVNGALNLEIKNKGDLAVPLKIQEAGRTVHWEEGFTGKKTITIPGYNGSTILINEGYGDLLKLNGTHYRNRKLFAKIPDYKIRLVPKIKSEENTKNLICLPMLAYNQYNKGMAGILFSNYDFIPGNFEFSLLPLYDFKNSDLAGTASASYHIWPLAGALKEINFSVHGKRFAYADNTVGNDSIDADRPVLNYTRLVPEIRIRFRKKKHRSTVHHQLTYRNISLWKDEVPFQLQDSFYFRNTNTTYLNYNELIYGITNSRTLDPYSSVIRVEQGAHYSKIGGEFKYRFSYAKRNKGVNLRFFAGGFLDNGKANTRNTNFRMSGWEGQHDYLYDEIYFGRTDDDGFWKQQFLIRDGGFKIATPLGQSNKWIASLNLDIDLPVPLPISFFAGIGTYEGITKVFSDLDNKFMYEGGLALKPIKDILEIYVPLFYSDDINKTLEVNRIDFIEQIRFVFNINNLTPYAIRNRYLDKR